jgi:hypothetical protein
MKITVFLAVTPCNLVDICRRFKGTCFLCLQGIFKIPHLNVAEALSTEISENRNRYKDYCFLRFDVVSFGNS